MLKATRKAFINCIFFLSPFILSAQNDADFMRSTGKIYVVVAVIAAIFIGIVVYLISLDRKITNLENQIIDND